MKKGKICQ